MLTILYIKLLLARENLIVESYRYILNTSRYILKLIVKFDRLNITSLAKATLL